MALLPQVMEDSSLVPRKHILCPRFYRFDNSQVHGTFLALTSSLLESWFVTQHGMEKRYVIGTGGASTGRVRNRPRRRGHLWLPFRPVCALRASPREMTMRKLSRISEMNQQGRHNLEIIFLPARGRFAVVGILDHQANAQRIDQRRLHS